MLDKLIFLGLYLNPFVAKNEKYMGKIYSLADSGIINLIVIDLKTEHGKVWFDEKELKEISKKCEEKNIYLIVRIVCFLDNYLSKKEPERAILSKKTHNLWQDIHGNNWLNPFDTLNWNYNIEIAEFAAKCNVKEIHFDYLRFPSDGDLLDMDLKNQLNLEKEEVIKEFLRKAFLRLKKYNVLIVPCLFGFSPFWNSIKREGQKIEEVSKYSDRIALMLYPSHYGRNFLKEAEPLRERAIYFEGVILGKIRSGIPVEAYVQGFNYKAKNFGKEYIVEQIKGAIIAGAEKIIIWNAAGEYKYAIEALKEIKNEIVNNFISD
ncbi:MAG: putative glycoside hydrolase [candidate division WOR-3 bacterium]